MNWVNNWLNLFRSLSLWEWIFWIVLMLATIRGFVGYPNILNRVENKKT